MSTDKKRKSGDAVAPVAKKAKTVTLAKTADRPAPLKSALKKSKVETTVVEEPKTKKSKTETSAEKPKTKKSKVETETVVEEKPKEKKTKVEKTVTEKPKEKKNKTTKKTVIEEPVQEEDASVEDAVEGGAELTADQTAALLAGFSSDEDSETEAQEDGIAIESLPAPPKSKSSKKDSNQEDDPETTPGTIYISRLPHGFFEPQLTAYFTQFGTITHLRLARNSRTGKSKHHAFIEFASASVADIVAKTMDKYLMFGHILQVRRVPQEQVTEGMWKGPGRKVAPRNRLEGARLKRGEGREGWGKRVAREEKRRLGKKEKLAEMGYEFEMPAVKSVENVAVKEIDGVEDGVQLIEGRREEKEPGVEEKIETVVEDGKITVTQEKKVKRKSKDAAAVEKTATKKRKTKAA